MRMTRQRKAILALFEQSKKPLSAEMIMSTLKDQHMDLSTIYRTLETFHDTGYISKSNIDQTSYYYFNRKDHHHYMICIHCHKMIPVDCHLGNFSEEVAQKHGFKITHHDMTLYGYCQSCQQYINKG